MNKLKKAEKYIRRTELAKLIGTNTTYLAVLVNNEKLTPEMNKRIDSAVKKVIRQLEKV